MNETEKNISQRIIAETGYDGSYVKIYDESQLEGLKKLGYSTPFVFSEEIDSQICYYTIEYPSASNLKYYDIADQQPDSQLPASTTLSLNKSLFSDFYFWESKFSIGKYPVKNILGNSVPHFLEESFISIPTPPPKTA